MALTETQKATQALAFAALLLKDSEKDISADNIQKLTTAAGVKVDASFVQIFASVITADSLNSLVERLSKVGGSAPAAATSGSAPAAKAEETKKEESESEEESDEDAFGGLF
jgi:large subunit ribosomal protein LP1